LGRRLDSSSTLRQNQHHIRHVAKYFYGTIPTLQPFQSCYNDVYRLNFRGRLPDRVIKVSRLRTRCTGGEWGGCGEILREQSVIRALAARGFEVPEIEFTQDDYPAASIPFTLMPFYPGQSLPELYQNDPRTAQRVVRRMGSFIARLGQLSYGDVGAGFGPHVVQRSELECWQANREHFREHSLYSSRFDPVFAQVRELLEQPPVRFGHRDGVQVIADDKDQFVVIDWGPAGATWRMADLGRRLHLWTVYDADYGRETNGLVSVMDRCLMGKISDHDERAELGAWRIYDCLRDAMFFDRNGQNARACDLIGLAERLAGSLANWWK
jgi:aminoglycoside phosphotransferase (APT) family kinase protein